MIHCLCVGVALERPPRIDQLRCYTIEAETFLDARITVLHMAARGAIMAVWDGISEDVPFLPPELFR